MKNGVFLLQLPDPLLDPVFLSYRYQLIIFSLFLKSRIHQLENLCHSPSVQMRGLHLLKFLLFLGNLAVKGFQLKLALYKLPLQLYHLGSKITALGLYALANIKLFLPSSQYHLEDVAHLYGLHQRLIPLLQIFFHGSHFTTLSKTTSKSRYLPRYSVYLFFSLTKISSSLFSLRALSISKIIICEPKRKKKRLELRML